jgi:tetratricopeptide (TPR) repeat protein
MIVSVLSKERRVDENARLTEACQALLDMARSRPTHVLAEGPDLHRCAERAARTRDAAVCSYAIGLALRQVQRLGEAVDALNEAERLAAAANDEDLRVLVLMSRSAAHLFRGSTDLALADLAAAEGRGSPELVLRVRAQRGTVLHKLGRLNEAAIDYEAVLAGVAVPIGLRALTTGNVGLLAIHRGDYAAARAALIEAERQNLALEQADAVADAIHNQAYLAACVGDVPAAIADYRRAADAREAAGTPLGVDLIDLGLLWLSLGLFEEALDLAELAEEGLRLREMDVELGDAILLRARALLGQHRPAEAYAAAAEAAGLFRAGGRTAWGAAAGYIACLARYQSGERTPTLAADCTRVADELDQLGWATTTGEANLLAGLANVGIDDDGSRRRLGLVAQGRRSPVPELRIASWHAVALMRLSGADVRGTLAAVRAGLREVHRQRASVGSPEIQATMSYRAEELASIALGLVSNGSPDRLLRWAEVCRSGSLRRGSVRADADDSVRQLFADRRVAIRAAETALDEGDVAAFARHSRARTRLERAIRARSRESAGASREPLRAIHSGQLMRALGRRGFIEFIDNRNGQILAVLRGPRGLRRTLVGDTEVLRGEVQSLHAAVEHLVTLPDPGDKDFRVVDETAERLAALLLGPLCLSGDGPLLIVPSGALFGVPWGLLPGLSHREVTIAPSAAAIVSNLGSRPPELGRTVLVAGPGLSHADVEVRESSRHHKEPIVLLSDAATPSRVLEHMDGASVVHLACHGRFRPEHPWFSSLWLATGELTVHELQLLERTPWIVILAACDVGTNAAVAGEEALGFVAALLERGTSGLIASPLPVADAATASFMVALHAELAAGVGPSAALVSARGRIADDRPLARLAAGSFVAYGVPADAGEPRICEEVSSTYQIARHARGGRGDG